MLGSLIGGGLGLLSAPIAHNQKMGEYNRQKELAARLEQWSPWTGMHGQMPQEKPNLFNEALKGVGTGLSMGAGLGGGSSWESLLGGSEGPSGVASGGVPNDQDWYNYMTKK